MSRRTVVSVLLAGLLVIAFLVGRTLLTVPQYEQRAAAEAPYSAGLTADAQWLELFNGRDLEGWTAKITGHEAGVNADNTYRVEDGAITVSYADYTDFDNRFRNLFYNTPYSH